MQSPAHIEAMSPVAATRISARPSARLVTVVGLCVSLLIAMSGLAAFGLRAQRIDADAMLHTGQVRLELSRILQALVDAETGVRGYVLSGDERMLQSYQRSAPALRAELDRLAQLVADNPTQTPSVSRLEERASDLTDFEAALLQAAHNGDTGVARALLAGGHAEQAMQDVRALLTRMEAEEDRLLRLRREAHDRARIGATLALWGTGGLGAIFLVVVVHFTRRDEAQIRRAERDLAAILRSIGEAVIATDGAGAVRFMNSAAERLTGYTLAAARARPLGEILQVIDEATHRPLDPLHEPARPRAGAPAPGHTLLVDREGALRVIAKSGAPITDEAGVAQGHVLVFRDISEERRVERMLELRDAELQVINDHARFPIARCDPGYRYLFVNRAYAERLGVTPDECIGRHVREVAGEAAFETVRPHMDAALRGEVVEFEAEIPYRGAGSRWMLCSYAPQRDAAGDIRSFVAAVTDITDKKRAERELKRLLAEVDAEKDRLASVLGSINDEVWFVDARGRFTLANRSALQEFGQFAASELDVTRFVEALEIRRPDGTPRPASEAPATRALAGESVLGEEELVRSPRSGEWRHREVNSTPVRDQHGQIIGAVTVVRDITERKRSDAALREADRRKDEFIATLSHELRNPLAPIRTAARILASPALTEVQLQQARSVIDRQVTHMALLLEDLLDIARITQGKLTLKKSRVTLAGIVDSAVEAARPLIDGKHHRLSVTLPHGGVMLDADPLRLSQMLSNLLMNAAKYTDPHGHIELLAALEGNALRIAVRDDGIGLASGSLTRIFDMFSQIDGVAGRSDGGLGIGLALVKGLVELHGGAIEARSEGLGRGSEFAMRLPVVVAAPSDAAAVESGEPGAARAGSGRRVLIADDNQDAADSLAMMLEMAGHEVRVAHSGHRAVSLARTFLPDTALLDIGMPDLSGYEVARELRREPGGAAIRIIALTGWGQDEDRRLAELAGFDHHLTKPVDTRMLEALIAAEPVPDRRC